VLAANIIKYPPFSFGPRYAAATGTSLLEGYRRQGRWALVLYAILTAGTMFTVQAAVTVVTAGLAKATLGAGSSLLFLSAGLTFACMLILYFGRFKLLDRLMKAVVAVLTVSTFAATLLVLPRIDWSTFALIPSGFDVKSALFLAALIGWMPSAIDISVWHSLWTLARKRDTGYAPTLRDSMLDFNIGYIGTALLAFCFLMLGAGVMHGTGAPLADKAGAFAYQVIALYTSTLGEWSRPLIGTCALLVMFSTTLTVIDGFPRAISKLVRRFQTAEAADEALPGLDRAYWGAALALALGSLLIVAYFLKSLSGLVDLATTLSFLTAPILSILNHRAILSDEVPVDFRPQARMVTFSLISIAIQSGFALWYLWIRFF